MAAISDYTGTALGWVIVIAVGGAIYLYYNNDHRRRPIRARAHRATSSVDSAPSRAERRNTGASVSSVASASGPIRSRQKKSKTEQPARPFPVQAAPAAYSNVQEKEDTAWATELANRKKGASLTTAPARTEYRQKTVRQSNANRFAAELSGDTSTTGADADDDLSPVASPDLSSANNITPVVGDIRDMLEPVAPGPAVLRLTEPESFLPPKQKAAPKPVQQVETKKQRQNKRKADEKKQQQEELEKIRKAQMESQRRSAREARGEPAKNGVGSITSNAWTAAKKPVAAAANGTALLDTFVEKPSGSVAKTGPNGTFWQQQNLPSEEEQMRILMEADETAWKTVSKKTRAKRKDTETENGGAVKPVDLLPESDLTEHTSSETGMNGTTNGIHTSDEDAGWTVA